MRDKKANEICEDFRTEFGDYPVLIDGEEEPERLETLKQNSDKLLITI